MRVSIDGVFRTAVYMQRNVEDALNLRFDSAVFGGFMFSSVRALAVMEALPRGVLRTAVMSVGSGQH
jgi:CRISPR/Cas system CMR-associated protein Cmr3 (group 5 of RAMP superfamily)